MDVGAWLQGPGLRQYEATFRDNEIDGQVLPNLTADDLKDLGVAIVGHRRKLLLAIGALAAASAAPPRSRRWWCRQSRLRLLLSPNAGN